jgi:hypothetical protein
MQGLDLLNLLLFYERQKALLFLQYPLLVVP